VSAWEIAFIAWLAMLVILIAGLYRRGLRRERELQDQWNEHAQKDQPECQCAECRVNAYLNGEQK